MKKINNCIYCFKNKTNGKVYIGQATNLYGRYYTHMRESKDGHRDSATIFHRAIRKYGIKNFDVIVLEKDLDWSVMNERETFYITKHNSTDDVFGYNICLYGNTTRGRKRPASEMEGIKKYMRSRIGELNVFYGKHHTDETKQLIRERHQKAIVQLDISGNFIKEWKSVGDASRFLNIGNSGIQNCISGRTKSSGGFKWTHLDKYKECSNQGI